ncbi:hypothetical protein B0537_11040 [Desulforamulus ferrireducens]|uniref:Polyprenyl synthetase n=2 Tax=Desulforamulus ferrireducens TaxID=1833852 RepID=A0A1S6IXR1_9FIRM|nr:hypothetical protein B0537_11040 [Desulforamulus ferrireducens]
MLGDVLEEIKEDLNYIYSNINSNLSIKAGQIGDYAHLELSSLDKCLRPAVVLLVGRLYNCKSPKLLSLGAIIQYIFMASRIHQNIPETRQTQEVDPRDGTQFPVLIGDYLYGKFFTTLCDAEILHLLRPLAEIIGRIHEGGILDRTNLHRKEDNHQLAAEIIKLETAELFAGAARLAGELAEAPEEDLQLLYEFGLNIGMGYGLKEKTGLSVKYFQQALMILEKLPNCPDKVMLENLVRVLQINDIRMVV